MCVLKKKEKEKAHKLLITYLCETSTLCDSKFYIYHDIAFDVAITFYGGRCLCMSDGID